jgi:SAM-dependent methyltransferase
MTVRALRRAPEPVDHTVGWYDRTAAAYAADTLARNPLILQAAFLARVPKGGTILDAGSGSGRDTLAFLAAGYDVDAFDASEALARLSSRVTGRQTVVERFETYEGPEARYHGVWAFASLLHVLEKDLPDSIRRLGCVLKPGGWLFANFKLGEGERTDQRGRRYTDMTPERARSLLSQSSDWSEVSTTIQVAEAAFGEPTGWVNVLARKAAL